ncbi:MAG: Potassium channel [Phylliscum demangeonii]|nr:MAG: Potassium channel [Phylliscum demangeonii]
MAIPLLAATIGPMANMVSIAAMVTPWKSAIPDNGAGKDIDSVAIPDPSWCLTLNGLSLACGFIGNFALLLNFTRRVPYLLALPITIVMWLLAAALLIGITAAAEIYIPPIRPQETYSQGFWYGVIAAILYFLTALLLMVNMLGYFLGHYPRHFILTDHQRTLILQTMLFTIWLAGGAAVFAEVCHWSYADALYFADVTVLTVGFGDLHPTNTAGRALVFPYAIGGIIMLGLAVNSIHKFMEDMKRENIFKKHIEKRRVHAVGHSITRSLDLPEPLPVHDLRGRRISGPIPLSEHRVKFHETPHAGHTGHGHGHGHGHAGHGNRRARADDRSGGVRRLTGLKLSKPLRKKHHKLLLLKEEKDRFEAMRRLQRQAHKFKRWYNLCMSFAAFTSLWCLGAIVFWRTEQREHQLTYFEALYFCYISLLTIGYGDLSPRSNAGKAFFVIWSLVAVPTMTILIGDLADTIVVAFNQGTFSVADWTVLPRAGVWKTVLDRHPALAGWLRKKAEERAAGQRVAQGFLIEDGTARPPSLEQLAEDGSEAHHYGRRLAKALRRAITDVKHRPPKKYEYEEWVEYTRLIRISHESQRQVERQEEREGVVEWDWIGEDSPMLAEMGEPLWVLEKLCDCFDHLVRQMEGSQPRRPRRRSPDPEPDEKRERAPGTPTGGRDWEREKEEGRQEQEKDDGLREHSDDVKVTVPAG